MSKKLTIQTMMVEYLEAGYQRRPCSIVLGMSSFF